jgi:DNA polymerase elongation subunit (family B)
VQDVVALLRQRVAQLRRREVPLEQLVVRVNVSRPPEEYRVRSSAAVAGLQLQSEGRNVRAGQLVKFVYVKGSPRVHAWDSRHPLDLRRLDVNRYCELIIRMASSLLQPIRVTEAALRAWVIDGAWYGPSPAEFEGVRVDNLPLFDIVDPAPLLQRAAV